MKKLLITVLLVLLSIPAFSLGIEADAYFGGANGFSAGLIFGSGKVTNSFGILYETHEFEKEDYRDSYDSYYGYHSYDDTPKTVKGTASDFGVFYRLDFAPTFVDLGKIKIGMNLGTQIAVTTTSGLLAAIIPCAKVSVGNIDYMAGYRGTLYAVDMVNEEYKTAGFRSSFSIGARYKFRSRNTSNVLDYIDTSSDPFVIKHDKIY